VHKVLNPRPEDIMITATTAIGQLTALTNPEKAEEMQNSYKIARPYLGVSNPEIDTLYKQWRLGVDGEERTALAADLWDTNIHEARIAAAKLLTQARVNPDDHVWAEIIRWVPELDHAVIANQVCGAGARRVMAHPERLDVLENWTFDENPWVRRSVMTMTLPWTKQNNPKPDDLAQRDRILGWMGNLTTDSDWLVQNAIGNWLAALSKHDAPRVLSFLETYGADLKPFAIKDACKFM
jgi:3-methyladenine DNA glycosylase AlkD